MPKRSLGSFQAPSIAPPQSMGIQEIMPFLQQNALMNTLAAKQNMTANSPNVQNPLQAAGIMQDQQSNFKRVPKTLEVGGAPQVVPEEVEKPTIPANEQGNLLGGRSAAAKLQSNAQTLIDDPNLKNQIGIQHPSAHDGMLGQIGLAYRSLIQKDPTLENFAKFRSSVVNNFQNYRKELEGVRGGKYGTGLVEPVFPSTEDQPEVFIGKTVGALQDIKQNDDVYLKNLSSDYKTSGYEGNFPVKDPSEIERSAGQKGFNVDFANERKNAIEAIAKSNKDPQKIATMFRQRTGQELFRGKNGG